MKRISKVKKLYSALFVGVVLLSITGSVFLSRQSQDTRARAYESCPWYATSGQCAANHMYFDNTVCNLAGDCCCTATAPTSRPGPGCSISRNGSCFTVTGCANHGEQISYYSKGFNPSNPDCSTAENPTYPWENVPDNNAHTYCANPAPCQCRQVDYHFSGNGVSGEGGVCACAACTTTPTPTRISTPTPIPPTPTPIPPTPTTAQPTAVVTLALPQAQAFSDDTKSKLGQSWICIESIPCSRLESDPDPNNRCSGGNKEHRVVIQTQYGTTLKMKSTPTYIFECISPDQKSYQCTTGDTTLDQTLISKSNLSQLNTQYGYQFVSYTDRKGVSIDQTKPSSVPKTTDIGTFGPYEWESVTTTAAWRLIMTMQDLDWNAPATGGEEGALQQATFSFINEQYNQKCVVIKWDPQGTIYNIASLQPIEGAKVTLYVKNTAGIFVPMEDKQWGLLANPITSSPRGNYQFFVPAGTYKVEAEKEGYELVTEKSTTSLVKNIKNIYDGREIVTKGEIQEVNILMRKKSMLHSIIDIVSSLFIHGK